FAFDMGQRSGLCYAALPLDTGRNLLTGKSACGAMLDAGGGSRAVTVFVTRHASDPAGGVQRCPGIDAVDRCTHERGEGRDGQWWQRAVLIYARRQRAVKADVQ